MRDEFEEDGWRGFLTLCSSAETPDELGELLWLFLTPEERKDVATRYLIVRELIDGKKTQRDLAKELGVSIAKITRGSNFLKLINEKLRRRLENLS
ncbi:MAG TPA: trp operon repressor [Parachlamydiales bacterium]|nr:trp operon repressor [Parachlamydiales bacterium]